MLFGALVLLLLSIGASSLRCYSVYSPDPNYKPKNGQYGQCSSYSEMCMKFILKQADNRYEAGVTYGCATQAIVNSYSTRNSDQCQKINGNMYCLCSGDLCNGTTTTSFLLMSFLSIAAYFFK